MIIKKEFSSTGLVLLEPNVYYDSRGYFYESYNQIEFNKIFNRDIIFVQDNESESKYGTIRGFHFQNSPFSQEKLVRVVYGEIIDVAVCIDRNSKNFGEYTQVTLCDQKKNLFWIPKGYAHGFQVLSESAIINYKVTNYYNKDNEVCIRYDDKNINFNWPIKNYIISEKDKNGINLSEIL